MDIAGDALGRIMRGLSFSGRHAFIGLWQAPESAVLSGIAIGEEKV